jgi:hypothetical protein
VVAPVLAGSDLLATLPALAMANTIKPWDLDSRPVPFTLPPLPHALLWNANFTYDPEIAWLSSKLRPIVKRHVC